MNVPSDIKELIDKLIDDPINFSEDQLKELINHKQFKQKQLNYIIRRIYDINEGTILNKSDAACGVIGLLNKWNQKRRNIIFEKKIKKNIKSHPNTKIILAEGDSWFEYPRFIKDVIDWLIISRKEDYAVHSLAYGADWLANMIYENKYIEDLQMINPHVFLISGGGNDIVGSTRLAKLIDLPNKIRKDDSCFCKTKSDRLLKHLECSKHEIDEVKLQLGLDHLNKEFFGLLNVFRLQYTLLFTNLFQKTEKFSGMKILTHGYDYPIPSFSLGFGWNPLKFWKPITNKFMKNGKWLKYPMMLKGISDQKTQDAIAYAMIFEFNEMMVDFTNREEEMYQTIHHIDCRGINDSNSWYNELHPESHIFKMISQAYQDVIDGIITARHVLVKKHCP